MFRNLQLFFRETQDFKKILAPENQKARRLVFYSEHAAYGKFFNPVLDALSELRTEPFSYLTSDDQDPVFQRDPAKVRSFYSKNTLGGLLPQLDSRALVMTMPDLNQFHIKRSQKAAEHLYLFHALMSTHMVYRKGAFDHYDTIFCAGPHHAAEIRRTEEVYGLKPKKLLEAGYPLLDKIFADYQTYSLAKNNRPDQPPAVLIAPSWAPQNIMLSCLEPLVAGLVKAGFRIILRPHPEFIKRFPKALAELEKKYAAAQLLELELYPRKENSLFEAEVLITDWSGIALEYAFGTERPVLFMDTPRKVFNPEYERLGLEPVEVALRKQLGLCLPPEEASSAADRVQELLRNRVGFRQGILRSRDQTVFHFGQSARISAEILAKSLS